MNPYTAAALTKAIADYRDQRSPEAYGQSLANVYTMDRQQKAFEQDALYKQQQLDLAKARQDEIERKYLAEMKAREDSIKRPERKVEAPTIEAPIGPSSPEGFLPGVPKLAVPEVIDAPAEKKLRGVDKDALFGYLTDADWAEVEAMGANEAYKAKEIETFKRQRNQANKRAIEKEEGAAGSIDTKGLLESATKFLEPDLVEALAPLMTAQPKKWVELISASLKAKTTDPKNQIMINDGRIYSFDPSTGTAKEVPVTLLEGTWNQPPSGDAGGTKLTTTPPKGTGGSVVPTLPNPIPGLVGDGSVATFASPSKTEKIKVGSRDYEILMLRPKPVFQTPVFGQSKGEAQAAYNADLAQWENENKARNTLKDSATEFTNLISSAKNGTTSAKRSDAAQTLLSNIDSGKYSFLPSDARIRTPQEEGQYQAIKRIAGAALIQKAREDVTALNINQSKLLKTQKLYQDRLKSELSTVVEGVAVSRKKQERIYGMQEKIYALEAEIQTSQLKVNEILGQYPALRGKMSAGREKAKSWD